MVDAIKNVGDLKKFIKNLDDNLPIAIFVTEDADQNGVRYHHVSNTSGNGLGVYELGNQLHIFGNQTMLAGN